MVKESSGKWQSDSELGSRCCEESEELAALKKEYEGHLAPFTLCQNNPAGRKIGRITRLPGMLHRELCKTSHEMSKTGCSEQRITGGSEQRKDKPGNVGGGKAT